MAAFIFECSEGGGKIIGSFPKQTRAACAYRGELLGLLAIRLILLATNKVYSDLEGRAAIYSNYLGAIKKVVTLPPTRIPSRRKHSDILKTNMINCRNLTFHCSSSHVLAHQDDDRDYQHLSRPAQLNYIVDIRVKNIIVTLDEDNLPDQEVLPLEPVAVFAGKEKMIFCTADSSRFWVHWILSKESFHRHKILLAHGFEEVAWRTVYTVLRGATDVCDLGV